MSEYIDRDKLIPDRCYYKPYGYEAISCEQIFHEDVADVVERSKIDKAIEDTYEIRREVLYNDDEYYEPNDVLDIIDQIIKLFEEL